MAYLLDTHIIIWMANDHQQIVEPVKNVLQKKSETIYFSNVSLWEIAIKSKLGKPNFDVNVQDIYEHLLANQYLELPTYVRHSLKLDELPLIHKDPFDRLLIAQAMVDDLTLITHDSDILKYQGLKTLRA